MDDNIFTKQDLINLDRLYRGFPSYTVQYINYVYCALNRDYRSAFKYLFVGRYAIYGMMGDK